MRNITVSVDEEAHRIARIRAAKAGISVSALVRNYLHSLAQAGTGLTPPEQLKRTLQRIDESMRARGAQFSVADNLSREELHDRVARRLEDEEQRKRDALR